MADISSMGDILFGGQVDHLNNVPSNKFCAKLNPLNYVSLEPTLEVLADGGMV